MPKLRDIAHRFVAGTQTDIEALTQRLGVERAKRAELVAAVTAAAREVAKAGVSDLATVISSQASVQAQEQIIAAVEQLLREAQQAERDRQREIAVKGAKSRVASIRQHLGKRERLLVEYQAAVRTIATVNAELQDNADAIEKLSPAYPFFLHNPAMAALSIVGRRKILAREMVRQLYLGHNLSDYKGPDSHPAGIELVGWLGGDFIHTMPDITAVGKEQSGWIIAAVEQELGLAGDRPMPSAQPSPSPTEPPQIIITSADLYTGPIMPPSPEQLEAAAEKTLADAIAHPGNPHPENSEEWREFNEVLAGALSPTPLDAAVAQEIAAFAEHAKAHQPKE